MQYIFFGQAKIACLEKLLQLLSIMVSQKAVSYKTGKIYHSMNKREERKTEQIGGRNESYSLKEPNCLAQLPCEHSNQRMFIYLTTWVAAQNVTAVIYST